MTIVFKANRSKQTWVAYTHKNDIQKTQDRKVTQILSHYIACRHQKNQTPKRKMLLFILHLPLTHRTF